MLARYVSAVSSGTLMTFALLYVMQLLISLQPGAATDPRIRHILELTRVPPDSPIQKKESEFVKEELIKTIDTPERPTQATDLESVRIPRSTPGNPPGREGILVGAPSDGALVNMVRVSPVYPARALAMGLEGYVVVQFDVDTSGRVINAVAIECSHSVFEKEAVRAAERFRFKARVIDGVPLETQGIRNMFTFSIEN